MKGYVVIVCVAICGLAESTSRKASFITPCRQQDAACLKSSAQRAVPVLAAGVSSMGIPVLDPMFVKKIKTSQAGLNMDFRNTNVTGLKNCRVLNLRRQGHSPDTRTYLDLKCSVTMEGDYKLGGKLLIMDVQGSGRYTIRIRDIVVKILFNVGEKSRDGNKYWVVKDWQHTSDVKKNVHFHFKNLFNGNKSLSKIVHEFANQNWRGIFKEVAPPIVMAIVAKIVKESTKLFNVVPIKNLVIE